MHRSRLVCRAHGFDADRSLRVAECPSTCALRISREIRRERGLAPEDILRAMPLTYAAREAFKAVEQKQLVYVASLSQPGNLAEQRINRLVRAVDESRRVGANPIQD